MLALAASPGIAPFLAALVAMLAIGLIAALGLAGDGTDVDADGAADGALAWLGVGRVPLAALLVTYLASFGGLGLALQQAALAWRGALLPAAGAVPVAVIASVPLSAALARLLARVLPRDETTAFPLDRLVGLTARVVVGRATAGAPARARVSDPHGQPHHVLVEPDTAGACFEEGDDVLLVRRVDGTFRAIIHDSPRFSNWIPSE